MTFGPRQRRIAALLGVVACAGLVAAWRAPVRWVSTCAGQDQGYHDGDRAATRFDHPSGLALDARDPARPRLYVADTYNHRVRMVDLLAPGGPTTVTIAGAGLPRHAGGGAEDGPGAQATFRFPRDLALDGRGHLYVADTNNHRVRRIDLVAPTYPVTTIAGGRRGNLDGPGARARFSAPWGLAHDGRSTLYVVDTYNHTLRAIALDAPGHPVTTVAGGEKGYADGVGRRAMFDSPVGVAVDPRGGDRLYVADGSNRCVRRVTLSSGGARVDTIGGAPVNASEDALVVSVPLIYPANVACRADGTLLVSDQAANTVYRLGQDGTLVALAGIPGKAPATVDGAVAWARFRQPSGLAVDPAGGIYVADVVSHRIRFLR